MSIGLPVYNGQKYLRFAVDSILAQTFQDFELILCDNASTDDTAAICHDYVSRDSRVRYVRQKVNIGVSRNFNSVLGHATAPYFKWASCDDVIEPSLLARCVDVLERHSDVVLAHTKARSIGSKGEPLIDRSSRLHVTHDRPCDRLSHLLATVTYCNAQYGVMRTDVLRRTPLFGSFLGSDICFLAELSLHGKLYEVPEYLLNRRFHGDASSSYSPEQLLSYYRLGGSRIALYNWRHLGENLRACQRAPLTHSERARIVRLLLRRAVWMRGALGIEIKGLVWYLLGLAPDAYAPALTLGRPPVPQPASAQRPEGHPG